MDGDILRLDVSPPQPTPPNKDYFDFTELHPFDPTNRKRGFLFDKVKTLIPLRSRDE